MTNVVEQKLDGKQLDVQKIKITEEESRLDLHMEFMCEGHLYSALFYNASRIQMTNFSFPMQIGGFEIISNADLGWESDSRYMFNDFEETTLNFYFEDYEIAEI